jgi:hypothetical protein
MTELESIAINCFGENVIKFESSGIEQIVSQFNISIEDYSAILIDIRNNLSYFNYSLPTNLSNLLKYATDALYVSPEKWAGSKNRIRITQGYKEILIERYNNSKYLLGANFGANEKESKT